MADPIFTPKNFIQLYNSAEGYLVGSGSSASNFNVGSRIRSILESFALVSGQTHFIFYDALLKAIPIAFFEGLGFTRKDGAKASTQITIIQDDPVLSDTPVPLGLTISVNGADYASTVAGVILTGQTSSGLIPWQSVNPGEDKNLAIDDINIKSGRGSFVDNTDFDQAINTVAATGGTNEESDAERRDRFLIFVNGLTRTSVDAILSAALSVSGVRSASVLELFPSPGWNTIYAEDGTGSLNPAVFAELTKVLFGDPADPVNFPGFKGAGIRHDLQQPALKEIELTIEIDVDQETQSTFASIENAVATAAQVYVNNLRIQNDFIITEVHTAGQNADPDVVDIRVISMLVNGVSTTVGNVAIAAGELAKNFVTTVTAIGIPF